MKFKDLKAIINTVPNEVEEAECFLKIETENYSLDSFLIEFITSDRTISGVLPIVLLYGE